MSQIISDDKFSNLEEIKDFGISHNKNARITERQAVKFQDAQTILDSL